MLCEARVSLSDWPMGQRRDVDPENEKVVGLLRAGFIVPLMLARKPTETSVGSDEAPKPQARKRAQ